jgi:enediyne biosynthesis protein E4
MIGTRTVARRSVLRRAAIGPTRMAAALLAAVAAGVLLHAQANRPAPAFRLIDITREAGIRFTHENGAFGKKYLPETMGVGPAFVDVDRDGDPDLVFANGTVWPERRTVSPNGPTTGRDDASVQTAVRATGARSDQTTRASEHRAAQRDGPRLYRNDGRGVFTDATAGSGLEIDAYGMGVAAADYDNDGWVDLLLTAVGQNRLLRNTGRGAFVDVTKRAGLGGREAFSTSALWVDYDRDGAVDLLVCNYVKWTPETDIRCSIDGREKTYCTPEAYRGSTSWLFRNRGNGTFEDVTAKAGLFDVTSKSLGATILDYDTDGWPDLFIANDTQPNKLYRNNRNGTFTELGLQAGVAFSEDGRARAGMGADAADYDNTGRPSVVVTNFWGEMLGLYAPAEAGRYVDRAPRSDVGRATRQTLGWGCFFFDVDLDGLLDLLVVNGHLDAAAARVQPHARYAESPHLFLNRGPAGFRDVAADAGAAFAQPRVGRGAAFADIDRDGDLDVVMTTNGGPAHLFRNDLTNGHKSVRVRLRGTVSNRDGIGALVRATIAGRRASALVKTGSSYLSQSELPITFGLGTRLAADEVVIEWPSGKREPVGPVSAGTEVLVEEGRGVIARRALTEG